MSSKSIDEAGEDLISKIVGWIVGILIIIWIVSNPAGAGNDVHTWINDIISFFSHLANG